MNVIVTILAILGLVYAKHASMALTIFDIDGSDRTAEKIGKEIAPLLFQNGVEKCLDEGHSGSLDNGKWYFKVKCSAVEVDEYDSEMIVEQTIHVFTPQVAARKNNCYYGRVPAYVIEHWARYKNVLKQRRSVEPAKFKSSN